MVASSTSPAPEESRLESLDRVAQRYLQLLLPPAGAALTFGLSLQAVQCAGKALRVSCATMGWSSLLGCLAVSSGSLAAGQVSFAVRRYLTHGPGKVEDFIISKEDAAFTMMTGIMAFKILGGSFCNLMPSHICEPGALTNISIRASGPQLAKSHQILELNKAFLRDGCHHCGSRSGQSIADHIPPTMIVKALQQRNQGFWARMFKVPQNIAQRFYPQCATCMKRQAAFLSNGKDPFVFHFKRGIPKPSHLAGFLLGAFTYEGSSIDDTER